MFDEDEPLYPLFGKIDAALAGNPDSALIDQQKLVWQKEAEHLQSQPGVQQDEISQRSIKWLFESINPRVCACEI